MDCKWITRVCFVFLLLDAFLGQIQGQNFDQYDMAFTVTHQINDSLTFNFTTENLKTFEENICGKNTIVTVFLNGKSSHSTVPGISPDGRYYICSTTSFNGTEVMDCFKQEKNVENGCTIGQDCESSHLLKIACGNSHTVGILWSESQQFSLIKSTGNIILIDCAGQCTTIPFQPTTSTSPTTASPSPSKLSTSEMSTTASPSPSKLSTSEMSTTASPSPSKLSTSEMSTTLTGRITSAAASIATSPSISQPTAKITTTSSSATTTVKPPSPNASTDNDDDDIDEVPIIIGVCVGVGVLVIIIAVIIVVRKRRKRDRALSKMNFHPAHSADSPPMSENNGRGLPDNNRNAFVNNSFNADSYASVDLSGANKNQNKVQNVSASNTTSNNNQGGFDHLGFPIAKENDVHNDNSQPATGNAYATVNKTRSN